MVKLNFRLKRSLIALCFQLLVALLLLWLTHQTIYVWLHFLVAAIMIISFAQFFTAERIVQLQYLDDQEWTLSNQKGKLIRDHIKKIIDHQLYIVIYFKNYPKPLVIWCDQLCWVDWKRLKVLAKLY